MASLEHQDPEPIGAGLDLAGFAERIDHMWDEWKVFLAAAASLAALQPLTLAEIWRYPELAALADVLDTREATLVDIDHACTADAAVLPEWITAVAHAAGLDLAAISTQAGAALEAWSHGDIEAVRVILAPPPSRNPELDPSRLDSSDMDLLINALGATSGWIAHTAYRILLNARDPAAGQHILELIPGLPIGRRYKAAILALANGPSPPEAAASMLDSSDPATRAGAAATARTYANTVNGTQWTALLERAQADSDMTVRSAAGMDRGAAVTATTGPASTAEPATKPRFAGVPPAASRPTPPSTQASWRPHFDRPVDVPVPRDLAHQGPADLR